MPIFDRQVGASADDVYRRLVTDYWSMTSAAIVAGALSATYYKFGQGLRFQNITIPQGATITVAYITLTCRTARDGTTCNTRVSAEDVDDAPAFADDSAAFDTRWAGRTSARVDWDNLVAWTVDTEYDSPSIVSVIQEIVDRDGWAGGNDIVIFWEDFENRSTIDYSNPIRVGYSYDDKPLLCVKLHIEYEVEPEIIEGSASGSGVGLSEATAYLLIPALASGQGIGRVEATAKLIVLAEAIGYGIGIGQTTRVVRLLLNMIRPRVAHTLGRVKPTPHNLGQSLRDYTLGRKRR